MGSLYLADVTERRARQRTSDLPWVETTATVVASAYNHSAYGEGDKERGQNLSYFLTRFSYRVSGVQYFGELRSPEVRTLGSRFSIRYDPSNPHYNSVSAPEKPFGWRILSWTLILLGLLMVFFILRYLI